MSLHGKIQLGTTTLAEWEIIRTTPEAEVEPTDNTICLYECQYIRKGHPLAFLMEPVVFTLVHRYGDGGSKLVSKMLARVAEMEEETT